MRTIRFQSTEVKFPEVCPVCLRWGVDRLKLESTFFSGRQSSLLQILVPYCSEHANIGRAKTRWQIGFEWFALSLAALTFMGSMVYFLRYWASIGQGQSLWNIPLAIFVGFSFGLVLWAMLYFWVSPIFASKATKKVRGAVRMKRLDAFRGKLDISFQNDIFAELTARKNLDILDMNKSGLKRYHLSSLLQCDDVRLVTGLNSDVLLDHTPTEREAMSLLDVAAQPHLLSNGGQDCFYDIRAIEIKEV
jgi:hypothetical protein